MAMANSDKPPRSPMLFDRGFKLRRRIIATLLGFQFASTVMELLSLFILIPVFQFIQANGDVAALLAEHDLWKYLTTFYGALGLSANLAVLLSTSFTFLLARQVFVYARVRYRAWARETAVGAARSEGFRLHLRADIAYQDKVETGGVVNDLTTDLLRGMDFVFGVVYFQGMLVVSAVYLLSLFALSMTMTATALAVFGVALFSLRGPMRQAEQEGAKIAEANRRMSGFLVERLHLTRLVRLSGTEVAETRQMDGLVERQRRVMVSIFTLLAKIEVIMEPIVIFAAFLFIYFSVTTIGMRLEEIGLFLVMVLRLLPVVKDAARARQSNRASIHSYIAVVNRFNAAEAARETFGGTVHLPKIEQGLSFRDVAFTYGEHSDKPALRNLTLDIPARSMMALVGPSGAGKSTLMDMIPRLRQPQSGEISIDGVNIDQFDLADLRRNIAYAPQNAQVFNVLLAEHIRYGKAGASDDEVRQAADLAGALGFIEAFPDGFDTMAGDKGGRLSGGQCQRLDLARALVRRAPLLLLDEPTGNLDAESEDAFCQALDRIRRETDTTVIIIAHRLSTVIRSDQIAVFKDGRVTAVGSHGELLQKSDWYASAFAIQNLEEMRPASVSSVAP